MPTIDDSRDAFKGPDKFLHSWFTRKNGVSQLLTIPGQTPDSLNTRVNYAYDYGNELAVRELKNIAGLASFSEDIGNYMG